MRSGIEASRAGLLRLGFALGLWWATATAAAGPGSDDPLSLARDNLRVRIVNVEAGIPPQCYTQTGAHSNPCWVCHTGGSAANRKDDHALQSRYAFSDIGRSNHWLNLFRDRRAAVQAISDRWMQDRLREDNYTPLLRALQDKPADFPGYAPDLDLSQGFDDEGFARDGSGWRAFRYKPFPGTFWPTNGSADTAMIRLPTAFRQDARGQPSRASYRRNLDILDAAIGTPPHRPLSAPATYTGGAQAQAVQRYRYPAGTEFLHPVYYVDPEHPGQPARRMKELRYSVKDFDPTPTTIALRSRDEAREQAIGGRPHYSGTALTGQSNAWGWRLQGYIEDADGRLRLQTREEQLYCMGCHTGLGVTVDSSFAFPRKPPGAAGWGLQSLAGIADVPQAGSREPEYRRYLQRVQAGDEFRANTEMLARFFPKGMLDRRAVQRASSPDITALITPSRARALALAKAYTLIVQEQSYALGRDALPEPASHVHRELTNTDTALKASGRVYRDGQLWLDWGQSPRR